MLKGGGHRSSRFGEQPRRILWFVVALAALGLGASLQAPDRDARAVTRGRPNILLIETDDQTAAEMSVLPNVRRVIGSQGVTFDRSFVSFSLCCPSRATVLTGQYAHNHGVRGNNPPTGATTSSTRPRRSRSGSSEPATTRST
jgi:N-acetylglucosamine-6-sulfatase